MMSEETRALVQRTREQLRKKADAERLARATARQVDGGSGERPSLRPSGCRRGRELWNTLTREQKTFLLGRMKAYPHLWPCARRGWNWISRLDCASCPDAVLEDGNAR